MLHDVPVNISIGFKSLFFRQFFAFNSEDVQTHKQTLPVSSGDEMLKFTSWDWPLNGQ